MQRLQDDRGYAMAALLVAMSVMAVSLSMLMPAWRTMVQREREAELVFRGQQYQRAIERFQSVRGAFPPSIDVLVNEKFLRKKYTDPITDGEFQVLIVGQPIPGQTTPPVTPGRGGQSGRGGQQGEGGLAGQLGAATGTAPRRSGFQSVTRAGGAGTTGPVLGVVSKSTATSFRLYNGRNKYNEWAFVAANASNQAGGGAIGTQRPGGPGTTGIGGRRGGGPRQGGPRQMGPGLQLPQRDGGR